MNKILPILLILLVTLIGFFSYKNRYAGMSVQTSSNQRITTASGEVISGEHLNTVEDNFEAFRVKKSSPDDKYETYAQNRVYFEDAIENNPELLRKNQGTDVFPSIFYLCEIFQKSTTEDELKVNLQKGKAVVLLPESATGALETYGGLENIQLYNKTILRYINGTMPYAEFYSEYEKTVNIFFSANVSDYAKRIGQVIVAIYGIGKEKFVDGESIDCSKNLEIIMKGKTLNP